MAAPDTSEVAPKRKPGALSKALTSMLMRPATVVANERVGENFHCIDIAGEALKNVVWFPGQKVQIALGSAFVRRAYTPSCWNSREGTARILAYAHGAGPASGWFAKAAPGDIWNLSGPRASLDLSAITSPLLFVGDETSFALAGAAGNFGSAARTSYLFEVDELDSAKPALALLGLHDGALLKRKVGDAHLEDMISRLPYYVKAGATFVLTGKASSIQRIRQSLKALEVPRNRILTKAYWAPGKVGLD